MSAYDILRITLKYPDLSSRQIGWRLNLHHGYIRQVWHRAGIFRGRRKSGSCTYDPINEEVLNRLKKEFGDEAFARAGKDSR
jgi:hypothetical protein